MAGKAGESGISGDVGGKKLGLGGGKVDGKRNVGNYSGSSMDGKQAALNKKYKQVHSGIKS